MNYIMNRSLNKTASPFLHNRAASRLVAARPKGNLQLCYTLNANNRFELMPGHDRKV